MKNWKTTVSAVITAAAMFVQFSQMNHYLTFPPWIMAVSSFLCVGGLTSFGLAAKDSNVTGGTTGQPSTPEALKASNVLPVVQPNSQRRDTLAP